LSPHAAERCTSRTRCIFAIAAAVATAASAPRHDRTRRPAVDSLLRDENKILLLLMIFRGTIVAAKTDFLLRHYGRGGAFSIPKPIFISGFRHSEREK